MKRPSGRGTFQEPVRENYTGPIQEPDLSQWEEKPDKQKHTDAQTAQSPATVTNAGYIVPEDSPYRRPAEKTSVRQDSEKRGIQASGNEKNPIITRRRRKINVTELFSDPEEELRQFDAPQHVIDSRNAYRDPVYPHGWQKSEDNEE